MSKYTDTPTRCQSFHVGQATLCESGVACPVELTTANGRQLAGIVRVAPAEVGFSVIPRSIYGQRQLIARAVRRVREALGGGA